MKTCKPNNRGNTKEKIENKREKREEKLRQIGVNYMRAIVSPYTRYLFIRDYTPINWSIYVL